MIHTEQFRDEVDHLDTGLPDVPDLEPIRRAGARARRRRRTAVAGGAGLLAAALAVPVLVLAGVTGDQGDRDRAVAEAPEPVGPAGEIRTGLADAGFGDGMRTAVTEEFPGATQRGKDYLADRTYWEDFTNIGFGVGDPPRWESLFLWSQEYTVDGNYLHVGAEREEAQPIVDPAEVGYCREDVYLVEKECRSWVVEGRVVVLHDGTKVRGQEDPDLWGRDLEVFGADGTREYGAVTRVGTSAEGASWAQARSGMLPVDDLVALALDERVVLPEPDRLPPFYPPNRPERP